MLKNRIYIYRNKNIDEIVEKNDLWNKVYLTFHQCKDLEFNFNCSVEAFINEVQYQCVKIISDDHPENSVDDFWIDVCEYYGVSMTSLCFSMVYALTTLTKNKPSKVDCFNAAMHSRYLSVYSTYNPYFEDLVKLEQSTDNYYEMDFNPEPELPLNIKYYTTTNEAGERIPMYGSDWWLDETLYFSENCIRSILNYWKNKEDKLEILNMIETAWETTTTDKPYPFAIPSPPF